LKFTGTVSYPFPQITKAEVVCPMKPELSAFDKILPAVTKKYPSWTSIPIGKTMFLTSVDQAGGVNLLLY
jgi:hypothetical protein